MDSNPQGNELWPHVIAHGILTASSATVPADNTRTEGNGYFKGCILMPLSGDCQFQPRPIREYTGVGGIYTLDEPFAGLPGLVHYVVLSSDYPVQRLMDIFNIVNAMLVTTETGGTITTTGPGTEDNIYVNNTPAGVFEPLKVMIDFSNQLAPMTTVVRVYYRIRPGGNMILKDQVTFAGVQTPELKNVELEPNRYGVQVTMELTAGATALYDWCVFYGA